MVLIETVQRDDCSDENTVFVVKPQIKKDNLENVQLLCSHVYHARNVQCDNS